MKEKQKLWTKSLAKSSARNVADVVVEEIERFAPFFHSEGHFIKLSSVVYSQGGCDCGCAPDFQFYYDGKKLAVLPCLIDLGVTEPIEQHRTELVEAIKKRLNLERVDLVMRGERPPEYAARYVRR